MNSSRPVNPSAVENRLRVLHVIYSFVVGGSEQLVLTLVRSMKEFEHAVVAIDQPGRMRTEFEDLGALTWCLNRPDIGKLKTVVKLSRIVDAFRPDIVHSHHLHELLYAVPAAAGKGVRLVHTEHEFYSLRAPKLRLALRGLAKLCDAVTGADEETVKYLNQSVRISRNRLHVIRNGIDVDDFRRSGFDRESLGLGDQDLVVGVVARLEHVKGHDILLKAFASVLQSIPEAALLIVGDGSRKEHLESLAQELGVRHRVRMLGVRRDIPDLMSTMDVIALCSREEGLPISLLEAMAAAKPVVATPVGGIPKLVQNGETGLLTPVEDVQATANAIRKLLSDPELRVTLGAAAMKMVRAEYSLNRTVSLYADLYEGPAVR